MYNRPELACVGFADLGLKFGERVQIVKGITLHATPDYVFVVKEHDDYIHLCMRFAKSLFDPDLPPRFIDTCMNKGDMLCGDAALRRIRDGKNIGKYEWI